MKTNIHFRSHLYLAQFSVECKLKSVEWGRPQMTIRRTRNASWIPKATNTRTGCVILIASPLQQWLKERASLFFYTYTDCLVISCDL
jgi:hypothetical protein